MEQTPSNEIQEIESSLNSKIEMTTEEEDGVLVDRQSTTVTMSQYDEMGLTSIYFEIRVSDPLKIGEAINAYTLYKIETRSNMDGFPSPNSTVQRRYSDFVWLQQQLFDNYPAVFVPVIPEKQAIGRFQSEFIELRRIGLERTLQKIGLHPLLQKDADWISFLVEENFDSYMKHKKKQKNLFKAVGDAISSIQISRVVEFDNWFESRKQSMDLLESNLRQLQKTIEQVAKSRRQLGQFMNNFGNALNELSYAELHKGLGKSLSKIASIHVEIDKLYQEQSSAEQRHLYVLTEDFTRWMSSIKATFTARSKAMQEHNNSQSQLSKAKDNMERSKMKQDEKLPIYEASFKQATEKFEASQANLTSISEQIKQEMDIFDYFKFKDFQETIKLYLQELLKIQGKIVAAWESFSDGK